MSNKSKPKKTAYTTDDASSISESEPIGSEVVYNITDYSNIKLFSESYSKRFDILCEQYGKILSWQSDRNLPQTHFNSNYTMITRKNANEMMGLLIVYLIIFASEEGYEIDKELGEKTTAEYIHLIELILMFESFCKYHEHKRSNISSFKKMVPIILDKFKEVVNCKEGNRMKITKFHLPLHFADDMIQLGTMSNYDSGICEIGRASCRERVLLMV